MAGGPGWTAVSFRVLQPDLAPGVRHCCRRSPNWLQRRRSFSPLAWYNRRIERSPIITKCITSGVLFAAGDVLAQMVTMEKGGKYDRPRMTRAAIFGAFMLGPLAHLHFNFMEWLVVRKLGFKGVKMMLSKVFIDQFTYFSAGINTIYLFSLPIMAGESRGEAWDNVRHKLWSVLKANWSVWPMAQLINFGLVPVVHQLNFVLVVSLGWATYLSWSTTKKPDSPIVKDEK